MSANRLLIYTGNATIDSEADYGVVVLSSSGHDTQEVKNVSSQEWKDEDGEEVFLPKDGVNFKAYDVVLTLGVKSTEENARKLKDAFIDAIKSKELAVKQDFFDYTLVGAYMSKVEEEEYYKEYMLFKVTFRVTKPTEDFVMPSRDPYFDEPFMSFDYAPYVVPSGGGTLPIRYKSCYQVKHIPLQDGTERTEEITIGAEWKFELTYGYPVGTTINSKTGEVTFVENSSTSLVSFLIQGSVTMNGKTSSTTAVVRQQARQDVSPFFVGQINVTAKQFANLSTQWLLDYSTQISQQLNHETETTMWSYFFMLPEDVEFVSLQYLSSGVVSTITSLADFNLKHDDVVIGEHTYKVYGMRTSPGERYRLTIRRP